MALAAVRLCGLTAGLVFSFNVNPGYDAIDPRRVDPDSCFEPSVFAPPTEDLDWTSALDRERAAARSRERIAASFEATVRAQSDPALANDQQGFFLVYLNSFNEWHEGHSFEPMMDASAIPLRQAVFGYHNPARGDYRLSTLGGLLRAVLAYVPVERVAAATMPAPPRPPPIPDANRGSSGSRGLSKPWRRIRAEGVPTQ